MELGVTSLEVSLSLHIIAVVVGFGATFAEAVMFPVALATGTKHLPYLHRLQLTINRYLATPGLVVVLATGLYMVIDSPADIYDFSQFWISASLLIVIVIGGLLGAYFVPSDKKLGAMVKAELEAFGPGADPPLADLSEEYQQGARRQGMVGMLTGVLLVIAIVLMVMKPGL